MPKKQEKLVYNKEKLASYNFENLIGLTKKEVIAEISQSYNDVNADVWMYRLSSTFNFFKNNYLYLFFREQKVSGYKLRKFKNNRILKEKGKLPYSS